MWWQSGDIRIQVLELCLDDDIERVRHLASRTASQMDRIKTMREQMDEFRVQSEAEDRKARLASASREPPTRQPSFRVGSPTRLNLNATPFTAQDLEEERKRRVNLKYTF
jgi:hypothetical protein